MWTWATAAVCCAVLLGYLCVGFVNIYQLQYEVSKKTMQDCREACYSYYDEKECLLASFTGNAAEVCKKKLNSAIERIILQTKMIQITGEINAMDKELAEDVGKCGEDKSCVSAAMMRGQSRFKSFKDQMIEEINEIKNDRLKNVGDYMRSCIDNEKCKQDP